MMHVVDWLPTLVSAAGGKINDKSIDGIDQWKSLRKGHESPRKEFVYNIDPIQKNAGLR